MGEFYRLIAMARIARRMMQEDQEAAIVQAMNTVIEALNK